MHRRVRHALSDGDRHRRFPMVPPPTAPATRLTPRGSDGAYLKVWCAGDVRRGFQQDLDAGHRRGFYHANGNGGIWSISLLTGSSAPALCSSALKHSCPQPPGGSRYVPSPN